MTALTLQVDVPRPCPIPRGFCALLNQRFEVCIPQNAGAQFGREQSPRHLLAVPRCQHATPAGYSRKRQLRLNTSRPHFSTNQMETAYERYHGAGRLVGAAVGKKSVINDRCAAKSSGLQNRRGAPVQSDSPAKRHRPPGRLRIRALDRETSVRHGCRQSAQKGSAWGCCMRNGIALVLLSLALSAASLSASKAANLLEKNFGLSGPRYDRDVPACDYPWALGRITGDFETKEARFWNSQLKIVGFENIRETALLPWAAQSLPRRFCAGTALINDGARHPIYYSIAEDTGAAGMDWNVDFCVVGLDRNLAFGPRCRAAKP